MRGRRLCVIVTCFVLLAAACGGGDEKPATSSSATGSTAAAPTKEAIKVGLLCDRSGATQLIGINMCPGFLDYVQLVNTRKGGVDGHPIEVVDLDHAYEVPKAVAAYEQMKQQGVVAIFCYGTPIAVGLNEAITRDKIPCLTPGFGIAQASDSSKYPFQFPVAASYYSQGAAAAEYAVKQSGKTKPKIAYLYYDNPAGKEPLAVLEKLAGDGKFELQTFAVPAPGLDMAAQVTDITQRYEADFVIAHLFGRAPSVSIKAFKEAGYPLKQVVSLVWGAAEADIEAAGGFSYADGYSTLQFAGVGQDFDVIKEIIDMYRADGKEPPEALTKYSVYYNRGVFSAGAILEGIRGALKAGGTLNGETVRAGLETLNGFSLSGLAPAITVTAADHEGGGFTRIYQVKDGKLSPVTEWDNPEHDLVTQLVKAG